ncbi:S49 family peptidase [Arcicella aquatica]|uniref:S49 family peptidase n=1 Tax=Arcicella aquatica TaxID=217141 RepID=A0ABU5QRR5_9BACT|nr:S49 family peptidase [Arcicella aquatica]MEA5259450.1 S49 family peptidase [Arcicella aquatica]
MANLFTEHIWNIEESYLRVSNKQTASGALGLFDVLGGAKNMLTADDAKWYNQYFTKKLSNNPNVLVLPIFGEMGRSSNELIADLLASAKKDDAYRASVLKINTPGGTADSCSLLADAVNEFRKAKPLLVQTAKCYSAGYFVASQADEIWLENDSSTGIGSISSLIFYENHQRELEQQGISLEIFRAKGGERKALINMYEPLTEETRAILQNQVNMARQEFVGYVKRGRVGKIKNEEVFKGDTYNIKQGLELGLADKVGSLSDAIKRSLQLSKG